MLFRMLMRGYGNRQLLHSLTNNCVVSEIDVLTLIDLTLSNIRMQVGVHV